MIIDYDLQDFDEIIDTIPEVSTPAELIENLTNQVRTIDDDITKYQAVIEAYLILNILEELDVVTLVNYSGKILYIQKHKL